MFSDFFLGNKPFTATLVLCPLVLISVSISIHTSVHSFYTLNLSLGYCRIMKIWNRDRASDIEEYIVLAINFLVVKMLNFNQSIIMDLLNWEYLRLIILS